MAWNNGLERKKFEKILVFSRIEEKGYLTMKKIKKFPKISVRNGLIMIK
mgnify:CR=1 FL=1